MKIVCGDGEIPLTAQTESIGCKGGLVSMQTTFSLQRSNNLLGKDNIIDDLYKLIVFMSTEKWYKCTNRGGHLH